jgi:putative hydrolase of the HAD superfamily
MKVLLFDFDNTLAIREGGWTGAVVEALRRLAPEAGASAETVRPMMRSGFPWHSPEIPHPEVTTADGWWDRLGTTLLDRVRRESGAAGVDTSALTAEVRSIYCGSGWSLLPRVLPALDALSGLGWSCRVLSNHVPELPLLMSRLGLDGIFDEVHNSSDSGYEKPHPESFRLALSGVPPGSTAWMVGDNPEADVAGAGRAGLRAILVGRPDVAARWSARTLEDVAGIVEGRDPSV